MMRWLIAAAAGLPLFFCSASVCDEDITFPTCPMTRGPLDLAVTGDAFRPASGNDSNLPKGSTLQFGQVLAEVRPVIYADLENYIFMSVLLGYSNTLLKWKNPVAFTESNFKIGHIGFALLAAGFENWTFTALTQGNFNVNRNPKDQYTSFDIFFDARFAFCEHWGLHGGLYAETGMKLDRVLPVFGFDWAISPTWQLDLVFPYDMALVWKYSPCISLFLREHFFSFRSRLGNDPLTPKGLVRYQTGGTELGFIYGNGTRLSFDAHIGYSSEGLLRVSNRQNHDVHYYDFSGAPYAGGKASVNF